MPRELLIHWKVSGAPADMVSVLNFEDSAPPNMFRERTRDWLQEVGSLLHSECAWEVAKEGREFDAETGETTGAWSSTATYQGVGAITASGIVANATMALCRWRTDVFRRGRRVQGRTFIPGLATTSTSGGELHPDSVALLTAAGQDLIDSDSGLEIYSRPLAGSPGASSRVITAGAWRELAVQRGRRG